MDFLNKAERSALMARIGRKHTKPEIAVRRLAHGLGYRFRLHRRDLPGTPDLIFPKHEAVIFVHGCFWHQHRRCKRSNPPKSRVAYWEEKFRRNVRRDRVAIRKLKFMGWRVLVIWECQTRDIDRLGRRLIRFLGKK